MVKKILILGSSGMAGHMVYKYLESTGKYDLLGISRVEEPGIKSKTFDIEIELVECMDFILNYKPDVIINCIGVLVKPSNDDPARAIYINSLFPHLLENIGLEIDSRLIHISTDCVFDGKKGPYTETSWPSETNWYGRSKALGEVVNGRDLTIRTSIIGPELKSEGSGLFEWFMRQNGNVSGYSNVMWNGITTFELAKHIDQILDTKLSGLYHLVSSSPISKGKLLMDIQTVYKKKDVVVELTECQDARNKVLINTRRAEYDPGILIYSVQLSELKEFYDGLEKTI